MQSDLKSRAGILEGLSVSSERDSGIRCSFSYSSHRLVGFLDTRMKSDLPSTSTSCVP
jgi:hypothetical protein